MDLELATRLRLGASSCLLGDEVRYDGAHKRDHWIVDRFGAFTEWVRVCPEAEAGLGVPRPKIQLERKADDVRIAEVESGIDQTSRLQSWAETRLGGLDVADLDGWVFKARSPSCGVEGVAVHDGGNEVDRAPGFFAQRLLEVDPLLPTCTEEDVQVPEARRHFLERAQTRARWRCLIATLPTDGNARAQAIDDFLARHMLLLVCREQTRPDFDLCAADAAGLTLLGALLRERMHAEPTRAGHVRALSSIFDALTKADVHARAGLGILIDQVERGESDVEVPRQLARGLVLAHGDAAMCGQHYLDPVSITPRP